MPDLNKYDIKLMDIAESWSNYSSAERVKVGCVITIDDRIVSTGYNGTAPGFDNCCELDGKTKPEVIHAEMNAIMSALCNGISLQNSSIYVTMCPCIECAKLIMLSGVKQIYFRDYYRSTDGIDLLKRKGLKVTQIINELQGNSEYQLKNYEWRKSQGLIVD